MSVKPLEVLLEIDKKAAQVAVPLQRLDTGNVKLAALLDDVRSLWNVGSIFRSADGAGFDTLFLCGITGTPPRKEIAKTSLGAEDHVNWYYAPRTAELIPVLKRQGLFIVGLEYVQGQDDVPASVDLKDAVDDGLITEPLVLCVGNEVTGLSAETLALCDLICHLPMRGFKESLNVAVAFGIAAYEIANG